MKGALSAATFALAMLAASSVARADAFALLPPSGAPELSASARGAAVEALVSALRASGHRATPPADTARQLAAAHAPACVTLDCARGVLSALRVDAVLEVVLWSDGGGGVREVVVSVARAAGAEAAGSGTGAETSGSATVGAGGLAAATRTALAQALSPSTGTGPATHVTVRVSPRGAALTLDGRPLGQAPWDGALPAGHHVLVAGHLGYLVARRDLEVGAEPLEIALELTREPDANAPDANAPDAAGPAANAPDANAPGSASPAAPTARAPQPPAASASRAVLGPALLGAAGLALLVTDTVTLATKTDSGLTRDSLRLPTFITYGAVGVGALTTALLWFLLSGEGERAPPTATLEVAPGSLGGAVRVSF